MIGTCAILQLFLTGKENVDADENSHFKDYIKTLNEFCEKKGVKLLRTVGVVFNDDEKRVSQYVK